MHVFISARLERPGSIVAALFVLLALLPLAARADQQNTFISLNSSTYQTSSSYNLQGAIVPNTGCTFLSNSQGVYVQHQMNPRDSWFGDTSYNNIRCGADATQGFGDVELGFQHGISGASHPQLFGIRASVTMPTGYSIDRPLRLGYGRPGGYVGGTMLTGWHISPHHFGFLAAGLGVRAYTGYPAPQLSTNLTAGLGVTPGALVMLSYWGATALGAGGQATSLGINPQHPSRYDSYQITPSATFSLSPHAGLNVNVWNMVGGNNIGIGTNVGAGLWIHF